LKQSAAGFDVMVQPSGGAVVRAWEGGADFQASDLYWRDDDSLVAVVGQGDRLEVWSLQLSSGAAAPLTRVEGRVVGVAAGPDGAVFARVAGPDGHDLAVVVAAEPAHEAGAPSSASSPVQPPLAPVPVEARRYGLGPQELRAHTGSVFSAHQAQLEAGFGLGDPIGRAEHLLLGAWGWAGGSTGWRLRSAWRGPVKVQLNLAQVAGDLDQQRAIGSLELSRAFAWTAGAAALSLAADLDRPWGVDPLPAREVFVLEAGLTQVDRRAAAWGFGASVRGERGDTGSSPWDRWQGEVTAKAISKVQLRARYRLGWTNAAGLFDQFSLGGVDHSLAIGPGASPLVFDGAWAPRTASGQVFDRLALDLALPVSPLATRARVGDLAAGAGYTALGLVARAETQDLAFLGLSATTVEVGFTRQVETPEAGFTFRPWNDVAPWRAWIGLRLGEERP
jgi:hypothetical protein